MKSILWPSLLVAAALLVAGYTYHGMSQIQMAHAQIDYDAKPQIEPDAPPQIEYTITDLGTLGGKDSHVSGINARGEVVGRSDTSEDRPYEVHAFLYSDGKMQDLDTFGGTRSEATAINDAGDVAGKTDRDGNAQDRGFTHNFLYSKGKTQILKALGQDVSVTGMNNAGQMTGYSFDQEASESRAFLYSDGSLRDLGKLDGKDSVAHAINDKGDVVGIASTKEGYYHAFLYSGGKMRDLGTLGGWESYAEAINNKGQVVGGADPAGSSEKEFYYDSFGNLVVRSASTRLHAFIYSDGKMRDLGPLSDSHSQSSKTVLVRISSGAWLRCPSPQEYYSHAYGINASGQVVGIIGGLMGLYQRAFLYSHGKMVDLNTRVDLAHSGFRALLSARAINDAGQIVGEGASTDAPRAHTHVFLLTPVNMGKK